MQSAQTEHPPHSAATNVASLIAGRNTFWVVRRHVVQTAQMSSLFSGRILLGSSRTRDLSPFTSGPNSSPKLQLHAIRLTVTDQLPVPGAQDLQQHADVRRGSSGHVGSMGVGLGMLNSTSMKGRSLLLCDALPPMALQAEASGASSFEAILLACLQRIRRALSSLAKGINFPLLDRYLLLQMLPPFLVTTLIIATLGVSLGAMVELVREVVVSGLPLRVAVGAALLQAPRFLVLAFPLACLAATLLAFAKLKASSELTALHSAGVSSLRLLAAPLLLAAVAASATLLCSELVVPIASRRAITMVETALTTELHSLQPQRDVLHYEYGPQDRDHSTLAMSQEEPSFSADGVEGKRFELQEGRAARKFATPKARAGRNKASKPKRSVPAQPVAAGDLIATEGRGDAKTEAAVPSTAFSAAHASHFRDSGPANNLGQTESAVEGPGEQAARKGKDTRAAEGSSRRRSQRMSLWRVWYAERVEGGSMQGVTILEISPAGEVQTVICADRCRWSQELRAWQLNKCFLLPVSTSGSQPASLVHVDVLQVPMPNVVRVSRQTSDTQALSFRESLELSKKLRRELDHHKLSLPDGDEVQTEKRQRVQILEANMLQRLNGILACIIYSIVGTTCVLQEKGKNSESNVVGPFSWALAFSIVYSSIVFATSQVCQNGFFSFSASLNLCIACNIAAVVERILRLHWKV